MRQQARLPRYSTSKLPERFGLFTIVVLGESVAGSIHGLIEARRTGLSGEALAFGLIGIGIAFGLWWIYFDFIARRSPVAGRWRTYLWAYTHLPLWLGLTATGACIRALIEAQTMHGSSHGIEILVAISMAVALMTMACVEPILQRTEYEPFHRRFSPFLKGLSALAVLGIGFLPISGLVVMLLWLLVLALNALYGAWRWFQKPEAHAHYQG